MGGECRGIDREAELTVLQDKKHRFRQSDNINYFLTFVRGIGMPEEGLCAWLCARC